MARTGNSFNRSKPNRAPRPTVLIICEDTKSSRNYLEDAAIHFRVHAKVEVTHCGKTDPKGIVEEALRRRSRFDKVFCVVDRDTHPGWDEAMRLAKGQEGLEVISSFPCFEFWLILHFNGNRKPYAAEGNKSPADCCVSDLKKCESMQDYDKGKVGRIFQSLVGRLDNATKRSKGILEDAKATNEFNPSTRLHELILFFDALENGIESKAAIRFGHMTYDMASATTADAGEISVLLQANAPSRGGSLTGEFPAGKVEQMILGGMPVVIARREGRVVGVLFSAAIDAPAPPSVRAMLTAWPGGPESYVYGPVCIAGTERGRGLLPQLYAVLQEQLPNRDAILFIRRDNAASIRAHERLGMREVAGFILDRIDYAVFSSGTDSQARHADVVR
ncbi:RloB domain-containing protein [Luteibacter sp.]|uniref:RloB domain-containing protein n=1 Tax=Luteibacter sp. TaxID=1886636 RepID=UPI002F4291A2